MEMGTLLVADASVSHGVGHRGEVSCHWRDESWVAAGPLVAESRSPGVLTPGEPLVIMCEGSRDPHRVPESGVGTKSVAKRRWALDKEWAPD